MFLIIILRQCQDCTLQYVRGARYFTSLQLLAKVKEIDSEIFTKSGLMVGLGEMDIEIQQLMDDLRVADVDFLTVGQYLQPTPKHAAIERFMSPQEFDTLAVKARAKGFFIGGSKSLDTFLLSRRGGF